MPQAHYIYPKHITFTFGHFADALSKQWRMQASSRDCTVSFYYTIKSLFFNAENMI